MSQMETMPSAQGAPRGSPQGSPRRSVTVNLPLVTVQMRAPRLPHVRSRGVGHAVAGARSILPPPERMAYYAGLGALAVFGVIEWPVAAAIGAGTVIVRRSLKSEPTTPDGGSEAGGTGEGGTTRETTASP